MTYILTVVLFIANANPVAAVGLFSDRSDCGKAEGSLITKAMSEQSVIGFEIVNDCKPVKAANKI